MRYMGAYPEMGACPGYYSNYMEPCEIQIDHHNRHGSRKLQCTLYMKLFIDQCYELKDELANYAIWPHRISSMTTKINS